MALFIKHKETDFSVGDKVKVTQKVKEGGKERAQSFEGMVIAVRGSDIGKTFTVRKIGAHFIGIERVFPLSSPNIEKVEVIKKGVKGVSSAKLYYVRNKSKREIEKIYSRHQRRDKIDKDKDAKRTEINSKKSSRKKPKK